MTRGVVAWFDEGTEALVRQLWADLAALGVAALGEGGTRDRPHVTFLYGETLDVEPTLQTLSGCDLDPLTLSLSSVALFPPSVLYLAVAPTAALVARHRQIFDAVAPHVDDVFEFCAPGAWVPHATLAVNVEREQLPAAVEKCTELLPLDCALSSWGVEDGSSGQRWPVDVMP